MLQPPSNVSSFASSFTTVQPNKNTSGRNSPRSVTSSRSHSEKADAVDDLGPDRRKIQSVVGFLQKTMSVPVKMRTRQLSFDKLHVDLTKITTPEKNRKQSHSPNKQQTSGVENPFRAKSSGLTREKVFKKYEPSPGYLEQIGMTVPQLPPIFVQLSKSMAGGMISRYDSFRNIFNPTLYDGTEGVDDAGRMDRHEQIKELRYCTKSCYPTQNVSNREIELQNFTKEIVAAINAVIKKCQVDFDDPLQFQSVASPSSTMKQHPRSRKESLQSLLGDFALHNRVDVESTASVTQQAKKIDFSNAHLHDKIKALESETADLKQKLEERETLMNKIRRDYTRDLQNLRNALCLAVDPVDRRHAETVKLTIHVFNFNDLEGLSPELVELFNEKLQIVKEEAQIQIDQVTQNVHSLIERIEKYKSLKPEVFQLLEMPLEEIFEAVAVIEPLAFPVWHRFMCAFPQDHFSQIIKQVAEQMNQDQDGTYEKLIAMMHEGINAGSFQIDKMIDDLRERFKVQQVELEKAREEINMERWRSGKAITEMEKKLTANHNTFLREEIARMNKKAQQEMKQKEQLIDIQVREIDRLKRSKENVDLKMVIFKWRMVGKFTRFIDELEAEYLDKDSLKDLLHQDMQKLFFGNELHNLLNSLQANKSLLKVVESQLKSQTAEGHELRIKVNTLLVERNKHLNSIEKQKIQIWDLNKMLDEANRKRLDSEWAASMAKDQQKSLSELLGRQVKLKEAFEDKLRNTLDIRNGMTFDDLKAEGVGLSAPSSNDQAAFIAERKRQEETKKIILGFQVELNAKLHQHKEEMEVRKIQAKDINHKNKSVSVECQTEIHSATSRKLDLSIIHDNPVRPEVLKVPTADQGSSTDITSNIINFIANGSQKYETVMNLGLIRAVDVSTQKLNEQTPDEYIQSLKEQERTDGVLFNKRMKVISAQLKTVKPEKSIRSRKVSQKTSSQIGELKLRKNTTMRLHTSTMSTPSHHAPALSPQNRSSSPRNQKGKVSKNNTAVQSGTGFAMSPITKNNNSLSGSELNASSSMSSELTSDDDQESQNRDLIPQLHVGQMTEAPDYRAIIDRKNAETIFSSYVNLLEVIMQMDGKLYRTAVRTLKRQTGFKFKLDPFAMKKYKKLYPELIPNVFWRLWDKEQDEKKSLEKRQMILQAKQAWSQKLRDQGRLQEAESYFENELRMVSETATNLDVSVPYLNPIHINISQDSSPDKVQEIELNDLKPVMQGQQELKPVMQGQKEPAPSKQTKKKSKSSSYRVSKKKTAKNVRVGSVLTDESPFQLKESYRASPCDGIFSLPKNQYEMKVTICPKTTIRQSIQLTKCAPPPHKRVQAEISPHFSFPKPEISASTSYPGVKTSSLLSRSQKVSRQAYQAKTTSGKPITSPHSPLLPKRGEKNPLVKVPSLQDNLKTFNTVDNRGGDAISSPISFNPSEPTGLQTNIVLGEHHINKSLNASSFQIKNTPGQKLKRPATCKVNKTGGSSRMNNTATLNTALAIRTIENATSQDGRSTHQETHSISSKPIKDLLYGTLHEMRATEESMLSSRQRRSGNKPCPIKAFDMRGIPINQQDQMRSSLLFNLKTGSKMGLAMSQVLDQKRNMKSRSSRAQSATFSKNVMKQARQANGLMLENHLAIDSGDKSHLFQDSQDPKTVKLSKRIEFVPGGNESQGQGHAAEMRTSTQVIVTSSSVQESANENHEDEEFNPVSSTEDLPKLKILPRKESLIKVNDQLDVQ